MNYVENLPAWKRRLIKFILRLMERKKRRKPDLIVGDNYMRRWYVIPRNKLFNIYYHEFNEGDPGRALHDHRYATVSIILAGAYLERMKNKGAFVRVPGDVVYRPASQMHRIDMVSPPLVNAFELGRTVKTLFITGPRVQDWGFWSDSEQRKIPWQEYIEPDDQYNKVGPGRGGLE